MLSHSHSNKQTNKILGRILWAAPSYLLLLSSSIPPLHTIKPSVAIINMDMLFWPKAVIAIQVDIYLNGECNQRMLQALLLSPAVHVHLGLAWVGRITGSKWMARTEWAQSDLKKKAVVNGDSAGPCRWEQWSRVIAIWGSLHLAYRPYFTPSLYIHSVPSNQLLSATTATYY